MPVRRPPPAAGPGCCCDFAACARIARLRRVRAATALPCHPAAAASDVEYVQAELVLAAATCEWHRTTATANAAMANAATAHDDPRKLTWSIAEALRARAGQATVAVDAAALARLLGLVVALLPPPAP